MNYFDLFEIPVQLKTPRPALAKKYLSLQKKYHPDFFTQASETEQSEALEMSSMVNKAFKTLQSDDETIKYVLQLKGLLEEEEKYNLPPDFLMEMLELNEQVAEVDKEGIANCELRIADIEKEIYEPVKEIVEHYKEGVTSKEELLQVKEYYYKKKYLLRILEQLNGMQ